MTVVWSRVRFAVGETKMTMMQHSKQNHWILACPMLSKLIQIFQIAELTPHEAELEAWVADHLRAEIDIFVAEAVEIEHNQP
jgi:hypothetical protein